LLDIANAARVVPNTEIGDVVIERITGEVAAPDILLDRAIDIIADNSAFLIVRVIVIFVNGGGAERCHFDHLPAESDMSESKAATD